MNIILVEYLWGCEKYLPHIDSTASIVMDDTCQSILSRILTLEDATPIAIFYSKWFLASSKRCDETHRLRKLKEKDEDK